MYMVLEPQSGSADWGVEESFFHEHLHAHTGCRTTGKEMLLYRNGSLQAESSEGIKGELTYIGPATLFCFNIIYHALQVGPLTKQV